jgi:hypothetical protein
MDVVKVRLLVSRSGNDGAQDRGAEIWVPKNEVAPMVAAGQCEMIDGVAPQTAVRRERAVRKPKTEKATG